MPNNTLQVPYSDYYIWQMNDGYWHISSETRHQWNGKPDMPREYQDRAFNTQADAKASMERARAAFMAVQS